MLEKRGFPCGDAGPSLFGSKGGKTVSTSKWGDLTTEAFSVEATRGFDIVFLAASGDFATEYAKKIGEVLAEGGVVVDNSSALRYDADVPLVVPEVNGQLCKGAKVVANPNCTTAIARRRRGSRTFRRRSGRRFRAAGPVLRDARVRLAASGRGPAAGCRVDIPSADRRRELSRPRRPRMFRARAAGPVCDRPQALMALFPLFLAFGLKKVIVST